MSVSAGDEANYELRKAYYAYDHTTF